MPTENPALAQTEQCAFNGTADSTNDRYDVLARILHWIFAVIIIYVTIASFSLEWIDNHPLHDFLSHLNISLSTLLIPLFPLRAAWKYIRTNPPDLVINPKLLKLAYGVHDLLYLAIFSVLFTGFLMMPHGYMFFNLFWVPTPYEKGPATALFARIHSFCTALLSGLVILHVLGVIYHTVLMRVNILRRMLW